MQQFTAEGGYYLNFLSDHQKTFFLSAGPSALAGYETSNRGNKLLLDGSTLLSKDAFVYGGALTLKLETDLTDRMVLLLNVREWALFGSSIRTFQSQVGIGMKFIINQNGMYMRKIISKIGIGCCLVSTLLFFSSCDDKLEIQQTYPFTIETMPVPKKLKVGEAVETRCQLKRDGRYLRTTFQIQFFQPYGKGVLKMDNGTLFLLNDFYPLKKEVFRLFYTSASTDQQTIDVYVEDSFGQLVQLTFSFNNDNSKD